MNDYSFKLVADISGVESTFARFENIAGSAGKTAAFALRPFEKMSETVRAGLAGINKEAEAIKDRTLALKELYEAEPEFRNRKSSAGRIESAGDWGNGLGALGAFGGLFLGGFLGAGIGGALGNAVGGGLGFIAPEIDDFLDLSAPAQLDALLSAQEDMEASLSFRQDALADAAAKVSLALRSSPLIEIDDLGTLDDEIRLFVQGIKRFNERIELNLQRQRRMFEEAPIAKQLEALEHLERKRKFLPGRAVGGPVYPGAAFLVGERGPEIFVPDRAGRILPNGVLTNGDSGGGLLGDDFDRVILEVERLGQALDLALVDVPEEVRQIAEAMGGTFIQSLEQGRGVMEAMQEAGREAAGQLLHMLLQSEAVRGELGELADVIENVLNQALNGSIDSWEDLGRVALEVLQAIIEKMVEAQQAATKGGGDGGGILGTILQVAGMAFGAFAGGGSAVGGSFGAGNTTGAGGAGFSYLGYGGPRAGGGPVMPNKAFLVGEMGPELFVPKLPGHVVPNGALGGGGGNTFINNIYAPGANAESMQQVRDELRLQRHAIERVDRSVESRAIAEVWRQADRGGNFARSVGRRRD